jgi:hypothetical protein
VESAELIAAGSLAVAFVAAGFALSQARSARRQAREAEKAVLTAERANRLAEEANRVAGHANRQVALLQKRTQLDLLRGVLGRAAAEALSPGLSQGRWDGAYRTEVQASLAGLHGELPLCAALLSIPLPGAPELGAAVQEATRVSEITEVSAA